MAESGLGLAALTKNQDAKNRYTVATFPRESVSPRMAAVLDRLAADPVTRNIGIVSGPRDTAYNAAVGGAGGSQHKYSNALDLGFKGLPDATKSHVLGALVDAGVSRFGLYNSGAFHFDVRPGVGFWGALKGAFTGMTAKQLNLLPDWARSTIAGLVNGTIKPNEAGLPAFEKNLVDNKTEIQASLPYRMDDPRFTPALDIPSTLSAQQQAIANAHIAMGASRALNAQPLSLSPPNPGSLRGLNVPSALSRPSAPPSNFSVPDRPSPIGAAPVGQVTRAPLGPALNRPSPPSNFAGGTTPAAAPSLRQAAGTPTAGYAPKAQPAGTPTAGYAPKAQPAGTPTAGYNVSSPVGLSRPAAPSKATIDGALSQAAGKIASDEKAYADFEANRALGLGSLPAPPTTVNHPPNPTVGVPVTPPPALAAPPAQVLAPALVQRPAVNDYPVASIPAPPAATAYDVYSGQAQSAMDNTGQNTVGRLQDGTTTVTNKYGVTTGMTPYGKQTAIGSLPGISGPIGQAVKGAAPTIGGSVAGGLLAGPLGALLGGLIAKEVSKPGGLFSGMKSFNTDWFGNITTNKAVGGLGFPSAPSAPAGARNVRGFDSASDRSHAYGISPGAAAAIDKGLGGLY